MKTETQILHDCCEALAAGGYFFWRQNNLPVPGRAMPKYTPKGLPDIMILHRGRFIAVECKRAGGADDEREPNGRTVRAGHLSPFQAEWGANCALNGGHFFIVRSVTELTDSLAKL